VIFGVVGAVLAWGAGAGAAATDPSMLRREMKIEECILPVECEGCAVGK
jgi:hypothetical protein